MICDLYDPTRENIFVAVSMLTGQITSAGKGHDPAMHGWCANLPAVEAG